MKKLALLLLTVCIMNHAFAKVQTPETLLPPSVDSAVYTNPYTGESSYIRKGTIGATILNIHELNILLQNTPSKENDRLVREIMDQNNKLLASLKVLGLFNVFTIEEWISQSDEQPGRCLLGLLYLQHYPNEITLQSKAIIKDIQKSNNHYLKAAALSFK